MQMLSEDDANLRSMSEEELDAAWDLWFDLAQETNAFDPPYSHGVLVGWTPEPDRAVVIHGERHVDRQEDERSGGQADGQAPGIDPQDIAGSGTGCG